MRYYCYCAIAVFSQAIIFISLVAYAINSRQMLYDFIEISLMLD